MVPGYIIGVERMVPGYIIGVKGMVPGYIIGVERMIKDSFLFILTKLALSGNLCLTKYSKG